MPFSPEKLSRLTVVVDGKTVLYLDGTAVFVVASDGTVFILADSSEEIYIGRKVILGDMTGRVGFFGSSGAKIQSVTDLSSSASTSAVRTTLMELIDALNSYGLIELG